MNQDILQKGTLLYNGKYRIDDVIEVGGVGITYKATLVQLDIPITIKELFPTGKASRAEDGSINLVKASFARRFKDFKDKFVEEGRVLAKFKHPNLVQIRDIIEENNTVYLIMDYIEDFTLESYVQQKGTLSTDESMQYMVQIAKALKEVHEKGFLHKDVRPSNILIDKQSGKAVLVGMGVVGQFVTRDSTAPSYAPMEQYIAQYTKKDNSGPYSDIYALAGTLYYCLLGKHPLSAVERQNTELPPPTSLDASISARINNAIMKAMAVKAESRYQNIDRFLAEINPKTAQDDPNVLRKGVRLLEGKYRIDQVLGQSGLGVTYKATLSRLDLPVVIKELFLPGFCVREDNNDVGLQSISKEDFEGFKKSFLAEGKILAQANHPNLVGIKDAFEANNTVYLVMEHLEGQSLWQYVSKKGKLSENEALGIIRQITRGLRKVHKSNFLHKDIRPSNIRMTKDGRAVLVGLGIKKDRVKSTADNAEMGYFPMEQYAKNATLGQSTDIYAVAAVLRYCLTGEQPTSAFDRYYKDLGPVTKDNRLVSERTSTAITKALAMKSEDRYQDVGSFVAALKKIDPKVLARRKRMRWMATAAMFLMTIASYYLITRETPPPTVKMTEYKQYMKAADQFLAEGEFEEAARYYSGLLNTKPKDKDAIQGLDEARVGQHFSMDWWNSLESDWQQVFKKAVGFQGRPDKSDLRSIYDLQELYCYDTQINSLEPVRYLKNLTILGCYNTPVDDLSPLKGLDKLKVLDCSSTKITTLEPLAALSNLSTLDCSKTKVSSLEAIRELKNLRELYFSSTKVSSLDAVRSLDNLVKLYCAKTSISNLKPISGLSNLKELYIYNTPVGDLQAIANLKNLNTLYCYKTRVASLAPIASLTNLSKLYCYDTQIGDLSPISDLNNLRTLYTYSTPINSIEALRELTNLESVKCYNTRISDLSPLANLKNLKELHCSKTQITDLTTLGKLKNLTHLDCSSTQVSDLKALAGLNNLTHLNCSSTQINNLNAISGLVNLKMLHFANTQNTDLSAITRLNNLLNLDCSSTRISSLSPIAKLSNISQLNCASTQINTLAPLSGLVNLSKLNCANNQINDLSAIEGLSNIRTLKVSGTNIAQAQVTAYKQNHSGQVEY